MSEQIIRPEMVAACFQKRAANSHKGTYGRLLSVCGSVGMAGAAGLAGLAALRSGVGLLTAAVPKSIYPILGGRLLEALFLPLPETPQGQLSRAAVPPLLKAVAGATAVVIGCGLGRSEESDEVAKALVSAAACPMVLDADGLNAMGVHIDIVKTVGTPLVLTPHPGEMARLTGRETKEVEADRSGFACRLADRTGAVVVLKGYHTLVAAPGEEPLVNETGTPGMATGGSGDVLAGLIGSFLAQEMAPKQAAMCGVYLHGLAGERAAENRSQHGLLPSDMIEELSRLFSIYE